MTDIELLREAEIKYKYGCTINFKHIPGCNTEFATIMGGFYINRDGILLCKTKENIGTNYTACVYNKNILKWATIISKPKSNKYIYY
jgi:hypothetical protein